MADATDKCEENVPGKYYVDNNCSACMVCTESAPDHFKMTDDEEHAFVSKQPTTPEEEELCQEALEECPEESIGDDGA
ncbi:MAG: ferredoxin [Planctomycetota bacterium]|jgi:ferredoxin